MKTSDYTKEGESSKWGRKSEGTRKRDTEKAEHSRRYDEKERRVERSRHGSEDDLRRDERDRRRERRKKNSLPSDKSSSLESGEVTPSPKKKREPLPAERSESERTTTGRGGRCTEREEPAMTSGKRKRTYSRHRDAEDSEEDEDDYRYRTRHRNCREKDSDRGCREHDDGDDEGNCSGRTRHEDDREKDRDRRRKERDRGDARRDLKDSRAKVHDEHERKRRYVSESPPLDYPKRREKDRDRGRMERDRSNDSRAKDHDKRKGKRKYASDSPSPDPPRKHLRNKTRWDSPEPEGSTTVSAKMETATPPSRIQESQGAAVSSASTALQSSLANSSATGQASTNDQINRLAFPEAMEPSPSQSLGHTDIAAQLADPPMTMVKEKRPEVKKIIIKMPKSPEKKQPLPNVFYNMKQRPARKDKDSGASRTESSKTDLAGSSQSTLVDKPARNESTKAPLPTGIQESLIHRQTSILSRAESWIVGEPLERDSQVQLGPAICTEESPPPSPSSRADTQAYNEPPPSSAQPIVYTLPADGEVSQYAAEYARCGCAVDGILKCTRCKIMRSSDRIINRIKTQREKWAAEAKASGD